MLQRFVGLFEKSRNYFVVSSLFSWSFEADSDRIQKQYELTLNVGWYNIQDAIERCGGNFQSK